jgi:hypothetical protein
VVWPLVRTYAVVPLDVGRYVATARSAVPLKVVEICSTLVVLVEGAPISMPFASKSARPRSTASGFAMLSVNVTADPSSSSR